MIVIILLFIEQKKALKYLVQGPGVRKTFRLSSHTPGYSLKSCPGQYLLFKNDYFLPYTDVWSTYNSFP